jgi:transposase
MSQINTTSSTIYAGLDVAKDSLALFYQGRSYDLPNDPKGLARLLRILGHSNIHPLQVIMEATGGYEQPAARCLHAAGIALSIVEPSRVRAFAHAKGRRAKTDPIDAAVLHDFGAAVSPPPAKPLSQGLLTLGELVTRRRQLTLATTCESNRSAHYEGAVARKQAAALLRLLREQIKTCEREIAKSIAQDADLAARAARLREVAGVGSVTVATLLADMPELGTLSDERAAALAGVAPYNRDSGPLAGTRSIAGGRRPVRCALYMAALTARRCDPIFKHFYERLLARGKKPKVIMTALMRKLILLLNRLLKNPNFKLLHIKPSLA